MASGGESSMETSPCLNSMAVHAVPASTDARPLIRRRPPWHDETPPSPGSIEVVAELQPPAAPFRSGAAIVRRDLPRADVAKTCTGPEHRCDRNPLTHANDGESEDSHCPRRVLSLG